MTSLLQNSLFQRVVTAVVLLAVIFATLLFAPVIAWYAVSLIFIVLAAREWGVMLSDKKNDNSKGNAAALSMALLGALYMVGLKLMQPGTGLRVEAIGFWICCAACAYWILIAPWQLRVGRSVKAGGVWLAIGLLLPAWIAVAQLRERGLSFLLTCLAIVWLADTAAYFAGRAFGKAKLAPSISPAKSWAGVYGAMIAVALYFIVLATLVAQASLPLSLSSQVSLAGLIPIAIALTAWSVMGDLFESKLKRECQVKDSGNTLPGHGGVLDRIDALLPVMPMCFVLSRLF